MITRSSFDRWAHINLADTVLSFVLENKLIDFQEKSNRENPILFDFTDAKFIDIAALVNCIATIVQRKRDELQTYIAYPKSKTVRDFLQVWRFGEAVENATNQSFSQYLLLEDHRYLKEEQTTYSGRGGGLQKLEYNPDWNRQTNDTRNFFEFLTFYKSDRGAIVPEGEFAEAPKTVSHKWVSPLISQVLAKHLGEDSPKDDVARVILYEAMSNAVRHPGAGLIQVVSRFIPPNKEEENPHTTKKASGTLRICIWDDGKPIAGTLNSALISGRSIHAFKLPSYMCDKVHVTVRDYSKKETKKYIIDQSEEITNDKATEARLLLYSLFPGVSRTAEQKVADVEPFLGNKHEEEIDQPIGEVLLRKPLNFAPGMGLYSLVRTVLDQFQGDLVIRSGNYRLTIKMAHDTYRITHKTRYKCKVTQYPEKLPPFCGNLLTIQIPI